MCSTADFPPASPSPLAAGFPDRVVGRIVDDVRAEVRASHVARGRLPWLEYALLAVVIAGAGVGGVLLQDQLAETLPGVTWLVDHLSWIAGGPWSSSPLSSQTSSCCGTRSGAERRGQQLGGVLRGAARGVGDLGAAGRAGGHDVRLDAAARTAGASTRSAIAVETSKCSAS